MSDTGGLGPRSDRGDLLGRAGDDFSGRLARWAAEARADDAATARARERWLRQQATEAATFAGVLVDLAECGAAVTVHVDGGRVHRGTLTAVGHDVVAMAADHGADVLVALAAVTAVTAVASGEPAGSRVPPSDLRLGDALADLAAQRAAVTVTVRGGVSWVGLLVAAGTDVATIHPAGEGRGGAVHVPIAAVVDAICR